MPGDNTGMLTTMSWVPMGAMRPTPARADNEADEAKAAIQRRFEPDEADEGGHHVALHSDNDDDVADDMMFSHGAGNIVDQIESDDESELDDITYKPTDLVFVAGRASDDPRFEIYVYDEPANNMYVHHDVAIPAFPLCSTWLTDSTASLIAVGTMHPYIEIWSLDVMDPTEPLLILGGCDKVERNYKRKIRKEWLKKDSHQDAVSAMQWNKLSTNMLASGSADHTLKVWDLQHGVCVSTYTEQDRVQATEWHATEAHLILSSAGNQFSVRDCRASSDASVARWTINRDTVETVRWDHHSGKIYASTSGGKIVAYESRMGGPQVWSVKWHGAETVIDISPHGPLMCAGGKDGHVSLWDLRAEPSAPISSRKLGTGQVFSMAFHPNFPHVFGAVGSEGRPLAYTATSDLEPLGFAL